MAHRPTVRELKIFIFYNKIDKIIGAILLPEDASIISFNTDSTSTILWPYLSK